MSIARETSPHVEFVYVPRIDLRSVLLVWLETLVAGAPPERMRLTAAEVREDAPIGEPRDPFRKC